MHKLTILRKDGSVYWVEHFNSLDEANEWIKEEITRPYWDKTYTYFIDEITPKIDSPEEIASKEKIRLREIRVVELKQKATFTKQETDEILKMVLDLLG